MVKYLIQDIIPPERKQSQRRHEGGEERSAPRTLDHQVRLPHSGQKKITRIQPHHHKEEHEVSSVSHGRAAPEKKPAHSIHPHETVPEAASQHRVAPTTKYFDEQIVKPVGERIPGVLGGMHGTVTREGESTFLRTWLPWIFGLFGVAAIVLFALNYFGGATVTVAPKKTTLAMDQKMSAFKNPVSTELPFAVMKITIEETKEVPATGEKTLTTKASGKIIVYNKQTTTQRLIKNTRFQSPTGKIYRINDSINVPKSTTIKGKVTPGSIEVTVFADEAGPSFNTEATDFTLPGLKGSPTFDKVYARGKGPITGGASGTIKTVMDSDLKAAREELRVQLETKLRTKARGDLAPSQISFDGGIVVELEEAALSKAEASSKDMAVVVANGTLYMVTFDRELLTKSIVGLIVQEYKGETVSILNLDALAFDMAEVKGSDLWVRDRIDFTLSGDPSVEWSIDEEGLRKVLYGVPKQSFKTIMAQFQTIESADAEVHPVWKRRFPTTAEDIRVEVVPAK